MKAGCPPAVPRPGEGDGPLKDPLPFPRYITLSTNTTLLPPLLLLLLVKAPLGPAPPAKDDSRWAAR